MRQLDVALRVRPAARRRDRRGTTAVGYSVLVSLICGAIIVAVSGVGTGLDDTVGGIANVVRAVG